MTQAHQRHATLTRDANRIRSMQNRHAVQRIIAEAADNALATKQENPGDATLSLDSLFVRSIQFLLASGKYNRHVDAFFARRGIEF